MTFINFSRVFSRGICYFRPYRYVIPLSVMGVGLKLKKEHEHLIRRVIILICFTEMFNLVLGFLQIGTLTSLKP